MHYKHELCDFDIHVAIKSCKKHVNFGRSQACPANQHKITYSSAFHCTLHMIYYPMHFCTAIHVKALQRHYQMFSTYALKAHPCLSCTLLNPASTAINATRLSRSDLCSKIFVNFNKTPKQYNSVTHSRNSNFFQNVIMLYAVIMCPKPIIANHDIMPIRLINSHYSSAGWAAQSSVGSQILCPETRLARSKSAVTIVLHEYFTYVRKQV